MRFLHIMVRALHLDAAVFGPLGLKVLLQRGDALAPVEPWASMPNTGT